MSYLQKFIMYIIMALLPMEEAAGMAILRKQFFNMWKTFQTLLFDFWSSFECELKEFLHHAVFSIYHHILDSMPLESLMFVAHLFGTVNKPHGYPLTSRIKYLYPQFDRKELFPFILHDDRFDVTYTFPSSICNSQTLVTLKVNGTQLVSKELIINCPNLQSLVPKITAQALEELSQLVVLKASKLLSNSCKILTTLYRIISKG